MTNFVMTNNVNMLGYKLKELRTNKKLKTMDVAQNLRIDQSLISKFESGLRIPTKEQLESLIELYEANSVELLNLWFASKVMSTIKEYPHYEDVLALVNEELSGYQKLINKSKQQVLSKPLMKILNEIDVIKKKIDALKPLSKTQLLKLNEYFFTDYTYESNKIEGNTLSLQETALVIKEGVTIGGKSVREHLEKSQDFLDKGNFEDSIKNSSIAFKELISTYEKSKSSWFHNSPFFFGKSLSFLSSYNIGLGRDLGGTQGRKIDEFIDNVKDSLEDIQKAVKILSLGIDYKKYSKFKLLTPNIRKTIDGEYVLEIWRKKKWTKNNCQFCIDFVFDCSQKLQEFDFDINELIDNEIPIADILEEKKENTQL